MNEADRVRDLLGAYVLGHLNDEDRALVEAALEGDEQLRREAAELQAVAELLPLVDEADLLQDHPGEPAAPEGLAEAVLETLRDDAPGTGSPPGSVADGSAPALVRPTKQPSDGRSDIRPAGRARTGPAGSRPDGRAPRWSRVAAPVAAIVLVAAVGVGVLLRGGTPEPGLGVVEQVEVEVFASGLQVAARLVPHTWGTEVFLDMTGLIDGEVYLVDLEEHDGRRVSAGTFLGDGDLEVVCVMNGAVLREDVAAIVVTTEDGTQVMRSELAPVDYRSV